VNGKGPFAPLRLGSRVPTIEGDREVTPTELAFYQLGRAHQHRSDDRSMGEQESIRQRIIELHATHLVMAENTLREAFKLSTLV
jgi:hypothetical protein